MKDTAKFEKALKDKGLDYTWSEAQTGSVYMTVRVLSEDVKVRFSDHGALYFSDYTVDPVEGSVKGVLEALDRLAAGDQAEWEWLRENRAEYKKFLAENKKLESEHWRVMLAHAKKLLEGVDPAKVLDVDRRRPGYRQELAKLTGKHKYTFKNRDLVKALYKAAGALKKGWM